MILTQKKKKCLYFIIIIIIFTLLNTLNILIHSIFILSKRI